MEGKQVEYDTSSLLLKWKVGLERSFFKTYVHMDHLLLLFWCTELTLTFVCCVLVLEFCIIDDDGGDNRI